MNGGEAGFPLPSTGRGIEGEGWAFPMTSTWAFPPLTPALSPLRGEGDGSASRLYGGASSFTTVVLPGCAPGRRSLQRVLATRHVAMVNSADVTNAPKPKRRRLFGANPRVDSREGVCPR